MEYLREFLFRPAAVGSIVPSSRALAETIVQDIDLHDADNVLEYGGDRHLHGIHPARVEAVRRS
ncbi:MAG TPA: hypothetical protein VFY29_00560 [Terriglobia bacterium]|nr:hypothetical protein [Terriglobia bacterium]